MKTPDEIKRGLECCNRNDSCFKCPYYGEDWCSVSKNSDALAYIRQLEAERDAAVKDVKSLCATNYFSGDFCAYCKYNEPDGQCHHDCKPYTNEWGWEWRGLPEQTKEDDHG